MRTLALVTLPTLGAGNRLRVEQYVPFLRTEGIELEVSAFFDDAAFRILYRSGHTAAKAAAVARGLARRAGDLARARRADLVLVYRESMPIGPPLFERMLRRIGIPYAFDFDDAIFLGPIHPANRRWSWLRHPSRVAETARGASAVIVGNEYLASWARHHNRHVVTIPTPVDMERHRPSTKRGGGPVVIGWIGSSTTAPYLSLLDLPLAEIARRHPDVRLRVVGAAYLHEKMPTEQIAYDLAREPADVAGFDIGVLPQPDDEWSRGKGAFKAILYMAAGVPVVASRVGVNPEVIPDGQVGYCVDGDEEWIEALDRLVRDPGLRSRLGAAGRVWVDERYSVRAQGPRLAAALKQAAAQ